MSVHMETLEAAAAAVRDRWPDFRPDGGMILGSGWSPLAEALDIQDVLPFDTVPGLGRAGVEGHAGRMLRATWADRSLLVFQGRRHWYEGEGWTPVAVPPYLLTTLGARVALITNAAGGIRPGMRPGDLMILSDHISLFGSGPLVGPHRDIWGPRFPDMSNLYDRDLQETLIEAGRGAGVPLSRGVYLGAPGPVYETPAEIRAWGTLGADAVGMSTVPEATLCHAAGMRVAGLSCISNLAAGLGGALSHQEVTEVAVAAMPDLTRVVLGFWERVAP